MYSEIKLRKLIIRYEGYKDIVYADTLGLPTVGIGHMDKKLTIGTKVSEEQIEAYYTDDIKYAIAVAKKAVKDFDGLDEARQLTLIQLAFNLANKLFQFKDTLKAIDERDFNKAADCLADSKWYKQVGNRGKETCITLKTGFLFEK